MNIIYKYYTLNIYMLKARLRKHAAGLYSIFYF